MSLTNTPDIIVNGSTIPASAIDAEIQYHPAETRRKAMIQAAETLIIGELLAQKAVEKGILSEADRKLTNSAIIDEQPALIDSLLYQEASTPNATEQECLRYFEANPEKFKTTPLIEASHILLPAEPKDLEHRAQTKQLAESLIEQVKSQTASFHDLAKEFSACSSKEVGGSLGQLSYGQTVSEFERQVFAADTGLMETPVESRFGYHVVMIAHKVDGKALSFELVKEKIQTYLNDKVKRKAISQYLNLLVQEAKIEGYQFDIDASPLMQ
jgi:peptidyl-prolyl cis-trans isomerase C